MLDDGHWDPVLYDKDPAYVQALQKVYMIRRKEAPERHNGGTYAKIIPNIIAYGPSFPGQRDYAFAK